MRDLGKPRAEAGLSIKVPAEIKSAKLHNGRNQLIHAPYHEKEFHWKAFRRRAGCTKLNGQGARAAAGRIAPKPISGAIPLRRKPILQGERVLLRMATKNDIAAILHFFSENKDFFRPTDPPRPSNFYTPGYWNRRVESMAVDFIQDRGCNFFIFDPHTHELERTIIGYANLSNIIRGAFHACYLGYGLAKSREGKGLMFESLRMLIQFAFNDLALHRIMANYLPENERSARVLSRLGFTVEGYARDYLFIGGKWSDHILSSLTNPSWPSL